MELDLLNNKIYLIKTRTIPPGFTFQVHYCRWVSPRPTELRVDKRIDIPFANIIFAEAHCKGDSQSGERFIDLGVSGFPKLIRMPFSSISPNEFRFPSKNVDHNIRHTVMEIIRMGRIISMGEDMFRFLTGKNILCLDNQLMVEAHVGAMFSLVRDKIPFRCDSCKKFLWINLDKLPLRPTKARCPACTFMLQIETPKGLDSNLKRYLEEEEKSGKTGDILVALTGEIRSQDSISGRVGPSSTGGVGKEARSSETHDMARVSGIDVDIDSILGLGPSETPAPAAPKTAASRPEDLEIDFAGIAEDLQLEGSDASPGASAGASAAPDLQLDDDFFKDILPSAAATAAAPAAAPAKTADAVALGDSGPLDEDGMLREISQSTGGRTCHVCGADVGSEKVCPSCFAEQMETVSFDDFKPTAGGEFEIRLKEVAPEKPAKPPEAEEGAPAEQPAGTASEAAPKVEAPVPFWEEKIWTVKIGNEVYPDLDVLTIEEWILSGSVVESDMVRKGETRWIELGSVPYFRTAIQRKKNSVPLDPEADGVFVPAPFGKRSTAGLIDAPILAGLGSGGYFLAKLASSEASIVVYIIGALLLPLLFLAIANGVFGRTPGKHVVKIGIINTRGRPIGFGTALVRTLFSLVTLGIGFLGGAKAKYGQTVYDKSARCFVVNMD